MILLDPELASELDSKLNSASRLAKAAAVRFPLAPSRELRLPSVRTLARFLGLAQAAVRLKGQVTILLTTDKAIRRLNRQFRGKDKATDVLSFPADNSFPGADKTAGDLAISVPTARRQAMEQGHGLSIEIKVLILHGLLHLAGYDHEVDTGKMARRELVLRGRLGLPRGLIERVAAETREKRASRTKQSAEKGLISGENQKVIPQGLKPIGFIGFIGTTEVVPFQSEQVPWSTSSFSAGRKAPAPPNKNIGIVRKSVGTVRKNIGIVRSRKP